MADTLEYEPLDEKKRQIRIFKLAPGHRNDAPCGMLKIVSLESVEGEFDALSYVWGNPDPKHSIHIDQYWELRIAESLQKALVDFRNLEEALLLWIDAICIDQGNVEEKGPQVQLMSKVYGSARLVRAWIDVEVDLEANAEPFRELSQSTDETQLDFEEDGAEFWYPVAEIFRDAYRRRLWIQQELVLAKDIVIHCRQNSLMGIHLLRFQETFALQSRWDKHRYQAAHRLRSYMGTPFLFLDGILQARKQHSRFCDQKPQGSLAASSKQYNMLDAFFDASEL